MVLKLACDFEKKTVFAMCLWLRAAVQSNFCLQRGKNWLQASQIEPLFIVFE